MAEVQTNSEAGEVTQIFIEFVMMQAQQAALFLGQIPNPRGGAQEVNLPLAKMFLDQLAVIHLKTQGNLNADEARVLESALQQLEAAFIEVSGQTEGFHPGESLALPTPSIPPAPAPAATPPAAPASAPEKSSLVSPAEEREEGRKRFTKSYGA